MIAIVVLAAVGWVAGGLFGWSVARRRALVAGIWGGMVVAHLVLPAGHPFRLATGGDVRVWLVLGALMAIVAGYVAGLGALRSRALGRVQPTGALPPDSGQDAPAGAVVEAAAGAAAEAATGAARYARHIFLREIGGPGQRRLCEARVLVVGAGGLGAPALLYLAAAGVGRLTVVDGDRVEIGNLQRQIIHADARIGTGKAVSAAVAIGALNPQITVEAVSAHLDAANGGDLVAAHDLVLDGTDDLETRYLVNRLCVAAGRPLIGGALAQWDGQLSLYDPARGGPCYECVFPVRPLPGSVPGCAEAGVAGPLPGVIGAMMAVEAVKSLTGAGEGLRGRLLLYDALHAETRVIATRPRPGCPVCGGLGAPAGWTGARGRA